MAHINQECIQPIKPVLFYAQTCLQTCLCDVFTMDVAFELCLEHEIKVTVNLTVSATIICISSVRFGHAFFSHLHPPQLKQPHKVRLQLRWWQLNAPAIMHSSLAVLCQIVIWGLVKCELVNNACVRLLHILCLRTYTTIGMLFVCGAGPYVRI